MKDDFLWLQQWYQSHCNKDWEQSHKIHLGTIDNPGWSLTVDLEDTELEDKNFQKVKIDRSEQVKENKRLILRFDKLAHTFFALAAIKFLCLIC
ncbi:Imm53 family immunity protein [Candidatus Rhabdochlamydia porcellionis]|jgi:hypothetical protein|uniref:Immunity protein 53 n=1 Tax=Candidatus Rhabdochlamydia porcellionis TaxID=225148 RepID=A0ABX8YZ08_9BACT|nr:Imm53 family immunity protein [Candidatus Rhabdochlamydia porcellionis]QZA58584.1 Immunity protein 53 [Candidatus Rhabdochlamydia porcellionis]